MGWEIKVMCDRCGVTADCEARKTCPHDWEEFEKLDKSLYKVRYWCFCPTCAERYRQLLKDFDHYEHVKHKEFFGGDNDSQ